MIVKNAAGTTVLTLGDTVPVDGYTATLYDEGGRVWRRIMTSSPYVHGEYQVAAALAGQVLTLAVLITGADAATVATRRRALLTAVEIRDWQLTVQDVTWVCNPADSVSPFPKRGVNALYREVTLTIQARPSAGV